MTYTIYVCPECGRSANPRTEVCAGSNDEPHRLTRAIATKVIPRSVADELAGIAQAVAPIVREAGETGLDYALTQYREATKR